MMEAPPNGGRYELQPGRQYQKQQPSLGNEKITKKAGLEEPAGRLPYSGQLGKPWPRSSLPQ